MAVDAEIKRVDSILDLSNTLAADQELISQECVAIGKMVMDKLSELQKKKAQAELICREISEQVAAKRHYYAANSSRARNLHELQVELAREEERLRKAKQCLSVISLQVATSIGAADAMVSQTKKFKSDSGRILESGHKYLCSVHNTLSSYNNQESKL